MSSHIDPSDIDPSYIEVEQYDAVRLIRINRPDAMNALNFAANDELIEVWTDFNNDDQARVAVLTGSGEQAFCAGADLKTYTMDFATRSAPDFRQNITAGYGIGGITRGLHIDKPVIAAINGYAISGGLEIALACDIRLASESARFGLQDVQWGFHPCDGGLIRLKEIVGLGHAMEMILSGEQIDAETALRIGLVNRVLPINSLVQESLSYAERLASRAPLAQSFAKDVMRRIHGLSMEEALRLESASFHDLAFSEDLKEGTDAFREKREANFKRR